MSSSRAFESAKYNSVHRLARHFEAALLVVMLDSVLIVACEVARCPFETVERKGNCVAEDAQDAAASGVSTAAGAGASGATAGNAGANANAEAANEPSASSPPSANSSSGDASMSGGSANSANAGAMISCGNGTVDPGETCDPPASCPTLDSCQSNNPCIVPMLAGSSANCDASCEMQEISACGGDDGCCPAGCSFSVDTDCSASCGDGKVDPSETCEPTSTEMPCPTSCDDQNMCTKDVATGSPAQCNVACVNTPITAPKSGDECCLDGANANNDADCPASCGNGVVEEGETCDGNDCPSSCDDKDSCTTDMATGAAARCNAACDHTPITRAANGDGCCPDGADANNDRDCEAVCGNGVREASEQCDGDCPSQASCDDRDSCTEDELVGAANRCSAECSNVPITRAANGDGCCPSGMSAATDNDCEPDCGNGVVEADEQCETGARSTAADSLPVGTLYDDWSCDGSSCIRRYALTPCVDGGDCGSGSTCNTKHCVQACNSSSQMTCQLSNGDQGFCASGLCWARCASNRDCPFGLPCKAYDRYGTYMVCDTTGALLDPEPMP